MASLSTSESNSLFITLSVTANREEILKEPLRSVLKEERRDSEIQNAPRRSKEFVYPLPHRLFKEEPVRK